MQRFPAISLDSTRTSATLSLFWHWLSTCTLKSTETSATGDEFSDRHARSFPQYISRWHMRFTLTASVTIHRLFVTGNGQLTSPISDSVQWRRNVQIKIVVINFRRWSRENDFHCMGRTKHSSPISVSTVLADQPERTRRASSPGNWKSIKTLYIEGREICSAECGQNHMEKALTSSRLEE